MDTNSPDRNELRYRWLKQFASVTGLQMDGTGTWVLRIPITALPPARSFDAAVDAAIAAESPGELVS